METAVFQVAALISTGVTLRADGFTVGPYELGGAAWSCVDGLGQPVPVVECWSETEPFFSPITGQPIPALSGMRPEEQRDWSAFGAAKAFVEKVGEKPALKACESARKAAA